MTLTPEKLDEIERLAECAEQDVSGPWEVDESGFDIEVVNTTDSRLEDGAYFCVCESDYNAIADYIVSLDPATVRELVRLARIAEFLIETAESYGGWTGPELSPAEFHISWGTQQHSPVFEPLAELNEEAKRWAREQLEEDEGHD